MKVVRVLLIILFIAALASLGAYLFSKRQTTPPTDTSVVNPTVSPLPAQQNPGDAVVYAGTAPTQEIVINASEYKFSPNVITIKKGERVKITLKNMGKMQHDWFVEGLGGASIDMTSPGATNSIVIMASQKGTFTTYCSVGSHRKLGMVGKLVVQ